MQPVEIRRDARCSALLVLLVLLFCAAAAWLAVRYPGGSGLDASAVSWASNGISESSSGRLFKAVKVRSYQGVRRFASFEGMAAPRPSRLHGGRACKNWAVTTTIFPPTTTVKQLAALPSWCLVVAGDKKGPPASAYNLTGVVYLTPAMQDALPFETGRHLRWNHFGRKNLGFLYAVAHGANWVYDTDDDNELQRAGERAIPLPRGGTLLDELASSHHLANLYPQMSDAPGSWPRGFPLDAIKDNRTRELPLRPRAWPFRRVGVLQSLADHDPDVDGIYRLTQRRLPFTFPKRVDRVARRDRSLTAGRVTDIWRAYFAQRLMWDVGLRLAFALPWVTQYRNVHVLQHGQNVRLGRGTAFYQQPFPRLSAALWSAEERRRRSDAMRRQRCLLGTAANLPISLRFTIQVLLGDFNSEVPLYQQAGALVDDLLAWQPRAPTLPGRIEELYVHMYERNIVGAKDVTLAQAWIADLLRLGYRFPALRQRARP